MKVSKQKSLKLNFIMNVILTMSSFIFPLITIPYVSRILQPAGTGKVSFAISLITYFSIFAQLGIPIYGIRACAKVRDDKEELTRTAQELFIINGVMCIISYICFFITLFHVPRLEMDKPLFLVVSSTILFNTIGIEWLYKALEQYTYITVRSIIFKIIALVAMFALIHNQSDYIIYGGISVFAGCASNVLNFINAHSLIGMKPVGNYHFTKHLRAVGIFFAMSVSTTIYTNLDMVMLGFMTTDTDVGYYNSAVKIKTVLVSIVTSLGTVLLPRASYYIEQGLKDKFFEITQKAIEFVMLIAFPLMLYFILFAKDAIYFLSGPAYEGSILPMQIIMPTLLLIGLSNVMGIQILVPIEKENIVLYSELVGAGINIVVNSALIPILSSAGAAIGTLCAEFAVCGVQFIALRKIVRPAYQKIHLTVLIGGLVTGSAASIWVIWIHVIPFYSLILSATLFFGAYTVVLTMAKEPLVLGIEKQIIQKIRCLPLCSTNHS